MSQNGPLLQVKNLTKIFKSGRIKTTQTIAVQDVSFSINKGEIVSIVGESGSGKTTVSNLILRLIPRTNGEIYFNGEDIFRINLRKYYKQVQVIFQNPFSSFNYFYKVDRVLMNAINFVSGKSLTITAKKQLMYETLKKIDINPSEVLGRYPHQLSGGQLQRFLLGRVLLIKPDLLIADEPTTMIDACCRSDVLNLLNNLRQNAGLSILFITHDIGQAQYISDRVLVMNHGRIIEEGPSNDVFQNPQEDYTKKLLANVPSLSRKWKWKQQIA